ncbi:hypothetical protein EYF80_010497 [Liparis tanakae]|uniref:Uncharacterized protein n=1 Tax=Liparis tanakae TaxID=230148 RepID=A0A4Z2IPW6_9TELE|nr:hypothetical protein EYF80_010497 [Liparis tanakae]
MTAPVTRQRGPRDTPGYKSTQEIKKAEVVAQTDTGEAGMSPQPAGLFYSADYAALKARHIHPGSVDCDPQ